MKSKTLASFVFLFTVEGKMNRRATKLVFPLVVRKDHEPDAFEGIVPPTLQAGFDSRFVFLCVTVAQQLGHLRRGEIFVKCSVGKQ